MPSSPPTPAPPKPPAPGAWEQFHSWTAHHIDWGDIPTWAAFIAAFAAAIYTARTLARERARDAAAEADQRRQQATKVSAWADAVSQEGDWTSRCQVVLLNLSDQPVTHVRLVLVVNDAEHLVDELRVLPPGSRQVRMPEGVSEAVEPLLFREEEAPTNTTDIYYPGPWLVDDWAEQFRDLPVHVEFTDAAGRRWLRDDDGLREIDTPPHLVRRPLPG